MNILVFTVTFYPTVGGVEKQTQALIYEFLKKGHNVTMINMQSQPIKGTVGELKKKGMNTYFCPGFLKTLRLFLWCNTLYMPNFSLRGGWFLLFRPFRNWVISHNDYYLSNKKDFKIKIKLFLIKFASENIAVSNSVANYINTKSKVIYNCYDNEIFKIYNDEERLYDFVFLGRLVSQKGCDLLIKACKSLTTYFTLNIIGAGPERATLEKMVENFELKQNIKFLGILEGEPLARMLNRHKIMVIPSRHEEGFGMVALEGMACGCRIIAADAGGLTEAVNGFGRIFNMGNQKELEYLLEEYLRELRQIDNYTDVDLDNYLAAQKKASIAEKYLLLFK